MYFWNQHKKVLCLRKKKKQYKIDTRNKRANIYPVAKSLFRFVVFILYFIDINSINNLSFKVPSWFKLIFILHFPFFRLVLQLSFFSTSYCYHSVSVCVLPLMSTKHIYLNENLLQYNLHRSIEILRNFIGQHLTVLILY